MATGREIREAIADAWQTDKDTYGSLYRGTMFLYAEFIQLGMQLGGVPKDTMETWEREFDYAAMAYADLSR